MPPKRKVVAKKAVVTEEIPELNVVEENGNTLNETSHFTIRRKVGRTLDKEICSSLEKLCIFEERMAYANTKVGMEINHPKNILNLTLSDDDEEDKKQLKSTNTRPKKVIAEKKVKKPKISRNRAKSEDRQTQIEDKVEVKSRRKQDKVESAVSPMVKVTKKKILRSNSVDRLAYEKPITIDVKNKNKNKPTITGESSKPPQRRALKNKEELPLKPKRTKKNILNSEENVPVISPPDKLKIKGTKKKQVFIDKEAVNLDTLQELPKQTAKTKMSSKKSKPPTNKITKVLKGALKAQKEINQLDEKLEESTDKNNSDSSDNDTVLEVKVVKRSNNIKKQDDIEQNNVDQFNESYVISDDNNVSIISEPVPKTKKIKKPRLVKLKAANKLTKYNKKYDSDSTDIDDTTPKLNIVKRAYNIKKQPELEQKDVDDHLNESYVISDDNDVLIISEPKPKTKKKKLPQQLLQVVAANKTDLIFARPGHEPKGNTEVVLESDLNHRKRLNVPEHSSEESEIYLQDNNDLEDILPNESSPEENKGLLELPKRGRKAKVDLEKVVSNVRSPELNNVNVEIGDIHDIHLPSISKVKEVKPTVAKRKTKAKK